MITYRRPVRHRASNSSLIAFVLTLVFVSATGTDLPAAEPGGNQSPSKKVEAGRPDKERAPRARSANFREFARGLDELARKFDSSVALPPNSEAAGAAGRLFFRLQTLPADERFELLNDWTIPRLTGGNSP